MFPWPKVIKGTSTNPFVSMLTSLTFSSKAMVGNEDVTELNIGRISSATNKEIAIHFDIVII